MSQEKSDFQTQMRKTDGCESRANNKQINSRAGREPRIVIIANISQNRTKS